MKWSEIVQSKFLDDQLLVWASGSDGREIHHRSMIRRAEMGGCHLIIRVVSIVEERWRTLADGRGMWRERGGRIGPGCVLAFELSRLDPPAWGTTDGALQIVCYGQRFSVRQRPRPSLVLSPPRPAQKKNGAAEPPGAFRDFAARMQ